MEKHYTRGDLTVHWAPEKCIHSRKCWTGLRSVFDPAAKPWVNMDGAEPEAIMAQVDQCPSGALTYTLAQPPAEAEGELCTISLSLNGPLLVKGAVQILDADGNPIPAGKTIALCRCGASANKPFCDGSHRKVEFNG